MNLHPLVLKIREAQAEMEALESRVRGRQRGALAIRQEIARQSVYIGGLLDAAMLTLPSDQISILLSDIRGEVQS